MKGTLISMDYSKKLAMSYYKTIATLNESHNIFLVQHQDTNKIYVKKTLNIYNIDIYKELSQHPICGIPQIIDYFELDNQLFIIENYISGQSLDEILNLGTLTLTNVIHYTLELCDILIKLHNMQPPIVHRDIKPSNIIITEHNHVFLLDFNAAKHFSSSSERDTVLLGTKGYAAPEQYGFGSSTPKTDIYAMGMLLKELTSLLPNIPNYLMKIINKCIQIDPNDRYDSVMELRHALENLANTSSPKKNNTCSYKKLIPPGFRTRRIWKMLLAIPTYLLIFSLSLTVESEIHSGAAIWVDRIFCLLVPLSIIFGTFNYMNIHNIIPLCNNKNLMLRIIGIILLDIILVANLLILLSLIVSFVL